MKPFGAKLDIWSVVWTVLLYEAHLEVVRDDFLKFDMRSNERNAMRHV